MKKIRKIPKLIIFVAILLISIPFIVKFKNSRKLKHLGIPTFSQTTSILGDISQTEDKKNQIYIPTSEDKNLVFAQEIDLEILSQQPEKDSQQIRSLANNLQAELSSFDFKQEDSQAYARLTFYLPLNNSMDFLKLLNKENCKFLSKKIKNNDLKQKENSLKQKIANLEKEKQNLSSYLTSPKTNQERLSIQSKIVKNQNQLNSYHSQLESLARFKQSSRLKIYLHGQNKQPNSALSTLKSATLFLYKLTKLGANLLIWFMVLLSPLIFLIVLVYWFFKKIFKKPTHKIIA